MFAEQDMKIDKLCRNCEKDNDSNDTDKFENIDILMISKEIG